MIDGYPPNWLRGVIEPCLLALIGGSEAAYGYELASQLESHGLGRVRGGSLYPALLRLEEQGLLVAEWKAGERGPGRKCYQLTPAGSAALADQSQRWDSFASSVNGVLAAGARK